MKVYVNEQMVEVENIKSAYQVRDQHKPDADIVILNGFIIKSDHDLSENDHIVLIKRGEMPKKEEMEALMMSRHTLGVHEKVKASSVAVCGLGGLGSNIAVALARIGVGKLTLIDFDVVEPSNLNRQHYMVSHIGMKKTEALKAQLAEINPFIEVITHDVFLNEDNILNYIGDVDVAVEAFDGPQSKATLVSTWRKHRPTKPIVAASGVAGYGPSNTVETRKMMENVYVIGDLTSEAKIGQGLMAPRVAIAAGHQANMVLRLIMGEK